MLVALELHRHTRLVVGMGGAGHLTWLGVGLGLGLGLGIGFGVWGRGRASLTFRAAVQYRVAALERLGLASEEDLIAHRVAARQRWCTRLVTRLRCTSMVFDRGPYHALHTGRKLRGSMSCPPPSQLSLYTGMYV